MRSVLSPYFTQGQLDQICQKYLTQRGYLNFIERTWPHLDSSHRPGIKLEGEDYIKETLKQGSGIILISGHNYGFGRLVGPALADLGYQVTRAGSLDPALVTARWSANPTWEYVHLAKDPWGRIRALQHLSHALKRNRIVHFLLVNRLEGKPGMEVEFYGRNFFLDEATFTFISALNAPVVPCFALCDGDGNLTITFHPPLRASPEELAKEFARLFAQYLKEHPGFVRFWKPLLQRKAHW